MSGTSGGLGMKLVRTMCRTYETVVAVGWLAVASVAQASRWTEEYFATRTPARYPFRIAIGSDSSVVGDLSTYVVQEGDTLLDVGRHFDLGYNEMTSANTGVDPWMPSPGEVLLIPTEFVLPDARPQGVIVNIPEMRLYHYQPGGVVVTYPVGLGRDDWRTPEGTFKIRGKTENPTWVIPESIRAEHIRDRNDPRTSIAGGDPENPLGHHRLELTLPLYALHGSNMPWGVGMQVSHGCIRLYNEDIAVLFREVPVGSPGEFLYQPVKVGSRNDEIYIEVHPDIYSLRGDLVEEARRLLTKRGWIDRVDEGRLRQAITAQSGLPTVIGSTTVAEPQQQAEAAEQ
jgi:L,D-transpeptidase ErfK/SrfK